MVPGSPSTRRRPKWTSVTCCVALLFLLWVLAGCGATSPAEPTSGTEGVLESAVTPAASDLRRMEPEAGTQAGQSNGLGAGGKGAAVSLTLTPKGIKLEPLPLRAGFPFTVTIPIHNNEPVPAVGVPVMIYLSAKQEQIGFSSFFQVMTVTVPARMSETLAVKVPVVRNLAGGEYQLWVQVNRLSKPVAQQMGTPTLPEINIDDNAALLDLVVEPFDAYVSDLCPGRIDVALESAEMWLEADLQSIHVRVHNVGNQAVYNLPVVVTGKLVAGVAYTPAIPPCGGTAEAVVKLDRPLEAGESVDVAVNPEEWPDRLAEDGFDNNYVRSVTMSPSAVPPEAGGITYGGSTDYDFAISSVDVEIVRSGIVLIKVYNLGTRDVAKVPVRIEGKAGRKVVDVIPLIEGRGLGVAAIQLGWLWSPKATLTLVVNPEGAKGAYPETNRDNNVVTFTLP
jgi:hypothetical protein